MYFSWVVVLFDYFFFLFLLGGEMQKVLVLFCSIPRLLMLLFLTGAETRVFRLSMHFSNAPLSQHERDRSSCSLHPDLRCAIHVI